MWSSSKLRAEMFSITEWMTHRFKCLKFSFIALLRAFEILISFIAYVIAVLGACSKQIWKIIINKNVLEPQEDVLIISLNSFNKL